MITLQLQLFFEYLNHLITGIFFFADGLKFDPKPLYRGLSLLDRILKVVVCCLGDLLMYVSLDVSVDANTNSCPCQFFFVVSLLKLQFFF